MNVYDFDNTIYKGDSTTDFVKWCIKRNPALSVKILKGGLSFCAYKVNLCSKTFFKEKIYSMFQSIPNIDNEVSAFWIEHSKNIKKWYLENKKTDDVIISASPEFLLAPICKQLNITNLMASKVDKKTGFYFGINCYGEEKVRRFHEKFCNEIDEFYSDSLSDTPLAKLAKKAYLVDDNTIIPWRF